ncbi:hypothetical protein FBEOM_1174 [Fusarium beomiforme]|uniref:Uncharacterized protein n=1 Tax=Fusarium beomiforme TaxID=44412 RepID=A0A9P5AUD8_9HYPO|nr:hypothetical protein FBEOM_1174 [Fusarium beomiforme]
MSTQHYNATSQKCDLLRLPTELLCSIIEDSDLDWTDPVNIHHVSSRLFHLTFKQVYDGKKDRFKFACSIANMNLMVDCLIYRNVSISDIWKPYRNTYGVDLYPSPLSFLSRGWCRGKFSSADQYLKAAECLFDQGCHTPKRLAIWEEGHLFSPILPPILVTMLTKATDVHHYHDICRAIQFLISKGLKLAMHVLQVDSQEEFEPCEYWPMLEFGDRSTMEVELQSACPPFLFELQLENLLSLQDLARKSPVDARRRCTSTYISDLLRILFDDLFAPCLYKGDDPNYFADSFEVKIKLMAKHDIINANEQKVLGDVLGALGKIEAREREKAGIDIIHDGLWCWRELCLSIRYICDGYFEDSQVLLRERRPRLTGSGPEIRIHEFLRPGVWYPPEDMANARGLFFDDMRGQLDPSYFDNFEDNTVANWTDVHLNAWNVLPDNVDGNTTMGDCDYRENGIQAILRSFSFVFCFKYLSAKRY